MKKLSAYLLVILASMMIVGPGGSGLAGAAEQSLVIPSPVEDYPELPQLELPAIPDSLRGDSQDGSSDQDSETFLEPFPGSEDDLVEVFSEDDGYEIFDFHPALLESTGTWLRRGYWYTEIDAVIFNRQFDKNVLKLMSQEMLLERSLVQSPVTGSFAVIPVLRRNDLYIGGSKPGSEAIPRIKIGRFLFRDQYNRDHTAEFTWYGGGEWMQQSSLDEVPGIIVDGFFTTLDVPNRLSHGNPAFNGAASSNYAYDSHFNNFELNYHLKRRLQQDQMVMRPDGEWVRKAKPTWTRSFLAGIRFFDLNENLKWDATDVGGAAGTNGNYRVRTDNDMFGLQVGASQTYERARWSMGVLAKVGGLANHVNLDSSFDLVTATSDPDGTTSSDDDVMSLIGEVSLRGKWHLRPNFSFRAALELMYVDTIALAPYQINFIPGGYSPIITSSNSLFMGGSVGFEGYW